MIRALKPDTPPPPATPRCSAMTSGQYAVERGVPKQCSHHSAYEIEGKPYCRKHAGEAAIQVLLRREAYRNFDPRYD